MDKDIINILDTLDISETDKLLDSDLKMDIDRATIKRIKKSVYKNAGLNRNTSILKRGLTVIVAAVLLLVISTFAIGVDNIANAFNRLFGFIPGYGIVENNETIKYTVDGIKLKSENENACITLNNVTATENTISASIELLKKNFDESKAIEEKKKEWEDLENGRRLKTPNILLYANGKVFNETSSSMGGGGETNHIYINFDVEPEYINSKTSFKLEYKDYNLSIDFKLKHCDSFDSLDEIGPTATKNNISITAVSNKKDNKLEVELYAINKSNCNIYSYTKQYDNGYLGKDIVLQTSGGVREYTTPGSSMGPNNKFYFDLLPEDKNLVLKIPFLIASSKDGEKQNIKLKIPKYGEKLALNKKVEFNDTTMVITQVEKIKTDANEFGDLRINFKYENKNSNKIMCDASFFRTNLFGTTEGGGYSSTPDENGIVKSIDFSLEKGDNKTLGLQICDPKYYLVDEYNLEIK